MVMAHHVLITSDLADEQPNADTTASAPTQGLATVKNQNITLFTPTACCIQACSMLHAAHHTLLHGTAAGVARSCNIPE
jgi:hypothetical protein